VEAAVSIFESLSQHFLGMTELNHEKGSQRSRSQDKNLNPRRPEYEAGLVIN
jgi:hypothetical protein